MRSFRRTFTAPRIEVPGKGVYEGAEFEEVPLGPCTADDAQKWAMKLLDRDLAENPGYRSRAELRARFAELTEDTPLEEFGVELPSHDELLEQAGGDRARYWSLAASVDLAPYPTSQEDLGALRIGAPAASAPAAAAPVEKTKVVRVPYVHVLLFDAGEGALHRGGLFDEGQGCHGAQAGREEGEGQRVESLVEPAGDPLRFKGWWTRRRSSAVPASSWTRRMKTRSAPMKSTSS